MFLEAEQVNRLFSFDAFLFISIVAVMYHLILIKNKMWKSIIVFHVAGSLNFLLEIVMLNAGTRIVETESVFIIFMSLFTLSWIDIGFFTSLAHININYLFKNTEMDKISLLGLNASFFIAMPFASINWGIFQQTVLTRRIVASPEVQLTLQVLSIVIVSVILFFTGYKRLLGALLFNGILFGISFQTRLYLAGIRQASEMSPFTLIIDTLTLATMPIAAGGFFCILFLQVDFITFGDNPPLPKFVMNLRILLAAAKVLISQVGLMMTFSLVKAMNKRKKKGEPWKGLDAPKDQKDVDSRALIGDAIVIYRALLERMDKDEALKVVKKTIQESAIMQLYSLIPKIKREKILSIAKSKEEREKILTDIVEKFPNTDWELVEASETKFAYRILRCRLVELVNQTGHPELSDAFCPGDAIYFERYQPEIAFSRPKTIGYGDDCCEFIFELNEQTSEIE